MSPTPSTEQNFMDTWMGHAPALDSDLILRNLIYSPRFKVVAADATLLARETGTVVLVYGGTAAVNVTLPAIAAAYPFVFDIVNGQDTNLTVTAAAADTAITFNDLQADSLAWSTSSEKIGGAFKVYSDGVKLFVLARPASIYQTLAITS